MLTARHDHSRHQNIRLAVRLRLQKCDDGKLAQVEFLLPNQGFERLVGGLDVRKSKVYERRLQFSLFLRAPVFGYAARRV